MALREAARSVVDAFELPKLVQLGDNLYGAAFFLMKLLPARFIMDRAAAEGRIKPGSVIIETSSGTFGLGLALLCRERDYRLILVSDPAIDERLMRRLTELGARVEICREPAAVGGFQGARLAKLRALQEEFPDHFWPAQYHNPGNPAAYSAFTELVLESIGDVGCVVGTVGSGGSMCGTTRFLRGVLPDVRAIGVDTPGSVLFGQPDAGTRMLRGLGNSVMPTNLSHELFDEVHWVSAAEGFLATRVLHREHGLYMGPTSGTAFLVARWWAQQHPHRKVVAIFPDEAYRYEDTIYNDDWLRANRVTLDELPAGPRMVNDPRAAGPGWSAFAWARRSYAEVMEASQASSPAASQAPIDAQVVREAIEAPRESVGGMR